MYGQSRVFIVFFAFYGDWPCKKIGCYFPQSLRFYGDKTVFYLG